MISQSIMELLLVVFFRTLEAFSVFSFSLAMFRINIFSYLKDFIFFAAVMAFVSTIFSNVLGFSFVVGELSVLILMVLLVSFYFKVQMRFTFVAYLSGYVLTTFMFSAISGLLLLTNVVPSFESITGEFRYTALAQTILFLVSVPTCWFLYRKGMGFVFLSEKIDFRKEHKGIHAIMLSISLLIFASLELVSFMHFERGVFQYEALIAGFILFTTLIWTFYIRTNRDIDSRLKNINFQIEKEDE